jgi:hypothetical protein
LICDPMGRERGTAVPRSNCAKRESSPQVLRIATGLDFVRPNV